MMRGRMVHTKNGDTHLQRYAKMTLKSSVGSSRRIESPAHAAELPGETLSIIELNHPFDYKKCIWSTIRPYIGGTGFNVLIGCRWRWFGRPYGTKASELFNERFESLGHSYTELEIPPGAAGEFQIEPNALHIWPRGGYMCIALPNTEKTFTVTLFLPNKGDPSFDTLPDLAAAKKFFEEDFADALPLMPNFDEDFINNPTSGLSTLYCDNWHLDGRAVLVGDAAHARCHSRPGHDCAFEDCLAPGPQRAFKDGTSCSDSSRKPNHALAIQPGPGKLHRSAIASTTPTS